MSNSKDKSEIWTPVIYSLTSDVVGKFKMYMFRDCDVPQNA